MITNFSKIIGDSGGSAKVFSDFANEMNRRGHSVSMVFSDDAEGEFFYPVANDVKIYNLRHFNGNDILFPLHLKIKREIFRAMDIRKGRAVNDEFHRKYLLDNLTDILNETNPEVIVSFNLMGSMLLLKDLNLKIPVVTMHHGDTEDYFHTYPKDELLALELSAVNQVLLPSFVNPIKTRFPNSKIEIIGNVVPQYEKKNNIKSDKESYKIIFLGRLVRHHKRPHLLIEAFSKLADKFPLWNVEIWGSCDRKSYLKEMNLFIKRHNLEERVIFKGTTHDVESVLESGDIFAFPSAYEGWGLSLTEAMAKGLPAIGFKSCVAVNEIIQDNSTGLLTDDGVEAFKRGLEILMSDSNLRLTMGKKARESIKPYAANIIWNKWEKLLLRYGNS